MFKPVYRNLFILVFLLAGFSSHVHASYVSLISADNPIHWWRFEDGASTTGATAVDSAGSGDGTYNGNVVFQNSVPGIPGQAARFDGNLDSVQMGNLGALPTQGTIEFWMYPEAMVNHRNPFTTGPLGSTSTGNRAIRFEAKTGGSMQAYIGDDTSTTQPQFSKPIGTGISTNQWHHVVLSWDTGAGTVTGYLDGVQTLSESNTFFPTQMSDVRVGMGWGNYAERSWLGRVDEVAIYDYQLSQAQVQEHFASMVPIPAPVVLFGSGLIAMLATSRRKRG